MKTYILLLILVSLTCCNNTHEALVVTNGILIENSIIVSANASGEIETYKGYLLADQSKIMFCGKEKPRIKGSFKVIEGQGYYVIPGLIDSHVHLNNIAGLNFNQRRTHKDLVEIYFKRLPQNFLYFGYTTLIDVDNYAPNTIERLRKHDPRPDIYTCGQKVQVMNDFEMMMNEIPQNERYQSNFLADTYNTNITYPDTLDLERHSIHRVISRLKKEHNICIKTLYEDASSGLPQIWELPTKQIIQELVDEAHKQGLSTVMHATSFEGQKFALDTQIDIIAHAMWNWTADPATYLNTNLPDTHKQLLKEIADKQIGYQPTVRTIIGEKDLLDNAFINDKTLLNLYPQEYIDWLQSENGQWGRHKILARPDFLKRINPDFFNPIRNQFSSDEALFKASYNAITLKIQKVLQFLAQNNANLLFGTDNGAMNMSTHPPGYNGYLEMQHWKEAGVSLEQIFKAATYNNAKAFDLINNIGTLEAGKTANMLILSENPLESLKAYNQIRYVIMNGEVIERAMLTVNNND